MKKALCTLLAVVMAMGTSSVALAKDEATQGNINAIEIEMDSPPFEGTGDDSMLESATEEDLELIRNAIPVDSYLGSQIQPYDIIGDDDRTLVANPHVKPYQNIVLLLIDYGDGKGYASVGTGAFIDSDIVLTAGHCLRRPEDGRDAVGIDVLLAGTRSTALKIQRITNQSQFHLSKNYTTYKDVANDYGFIKMNDKSMGTAYGWFGTSTTKANMEDIFEIAGFPCDKDPKYPLRMVTDSGQLSKIYTNVLEYSIDCFNGQSGSPIFNANRYIVGVHTVGNRDAGYNRGPRFSKEMLAQFRSLQT